MKSSKILKSFLFTVSCISAGAAFAGPTLDTLLGSENLANSSDADELAALQSFDSSATGPLTKTDVSSANLPSLVAGTSDEWVIDVGSATPGYFVLKFGTGGTNVTNDTYFFKNIGEMSKLVFANWQVNSLTGGACSTNGNNCNISRLSHYDIVGGTDQGQGQGAGGQVPEPASLALMGLGMLGLVSLRKRNKVQ